MTESPDANKDDAIIARVLGGDTNAFERLVSKYKTHVFRIVGRHVPAGRVEETAQDVFIRAFRGLSGFRGDSGFKPWLSAIAIRASYDCLRRDYRSREISFTDMTEDDQPDPQYPAAKYSLHLHAEQRRKAAIRELLDEAMAKLKPQEKIVLELVYLEGCSMREASDLLGWSVANVKIRSYRGRKKLNAILKKLM
jgi:RNA polymerase sigma-70 factor, ECF subfamily